ncbi:hypothetical protein QQ045_016023 [Rhodiola kirilowii]
MSTQQVIQPRHSGGFGRRKGDRDTSNKPENKLQSEMSIPSRSTRAGVPGKSVDRTDAAHDRLVFLISCFIGQYVDVQVKNGSIYTGIFHSTNSGKDFGVILKMAQLSKDVFGQKSVSETVSKSPIKTLIIPENELVQVIAKDVLVTSDRVSSDICDAKEKDILIDSYISQSRPGETERELERWVPDDSDPMCSNLDNVFDAPWNRGWDQFQANEALFGVKSTFDEELYTTKLERGPQTRELEREALRLAREIEGEETRDLHMAEERGVLLDGQFDIDEESKYSSVLREIDDGGYEENTDLVADTFNDDTFGDCVTSTSVANDSALPQCLSSPAEEQPPQPCSRTDPGNSTLTFDAERSFASVDSLARGQENQLIDAQSSSKESFDKQVAVNKAHTSNAEDSQLDLDTKDNNFNKESPNANASSATGTKEHEKTGRTTDSPEVSQARKSQNEPKSAKSRGQHHGVSPSSSVGSLSSEKSTLNPYAKEFKLNPNAKSFVPTQATSSPVSNGSSFYYPNSGPHMPGMPVGVGIGPSFAGHQPVVYNPQGAPLQSPQGYFHPNGPQYGQHMVLGGARPIMYMSGYPAEMPYKREY